jgi:hypothetical protein
MSKIVLYLARSALAWSPRGAHMSKIGTGMYLAWSALAWSPRGVHMSYICCTWQGLL